MEAYLQLQLLSLFLDKLRFAAVVCEQEAYRVPCFSDCYSIPGNLVRGIISEVLGKWARGGHSMGGT